MKPITLTLCLAIGIGVCAQAAELSVGLSAKTITELKTGFDKARLNIVADGAGVLKAQGKTVRFAAACTVVDTMSGAKITDGVGDCELRAVGGGNAFLHFQTDPGVGDRGVIMLHDGAGAFAGLDGAIHVDVSVNPSTVGKPVFLVESSGGGSAP